MRGRAIAIGVFVVAVTASLWMWNARERGDTRATPPVPHGSGSQAAAPAGPGAPRAAAAARVTITITDPQGPVVGATVRLAPEDDDGGDVMVVQSGADGVARADGLAPGSWSISAAAPGHEPAALPATKLAAGDDAKLAITLAPGGRKLTGTVTDVTGGPVAGARIDAAKLAGGTPTAAYASATTRADGTYEVTVAEGMLLVAARSADYAPQSRYVEVGASGAVADFALVPGGVIEGVVVDDRSRQPVPGARITARLERGGGRAIAAGADGRFRIAGLSPGAYELAARAGTARTKAPTIVGLGVAEQVGGIELLVGAALVVRGTVVDDANAAVAGATVQVLGRGVEETTTDARGAFTLVGFEAGRHALIARGDAHVPAGPTRVEVADADVSGVVVKVKAGLAVKGHVEPRQICDVALEPAGDGTDFGRGPMVMFSAPVTTAADGAFSLGPASAGPFELTARCASGDQGAQRVDVAPNLGEITVAVTPGASIAGRVVDEGGKPVVGVTVMGEPRGGVERTTIVNGMVTSGVKAVTTGAGTFELKGLAPGTYALSALDRGHPMRTRGKPPTVTVAAREQKRGVELAVDRATGTITGVVTGPDGQPLADAWVSVHQDLEAMLRAMRDPRAGEAPASGSRTIMMQVTDDETGGTAGQFQPALTDASGAFSIGNLPHGTYEVLAEAQQGRLRGRASNVTPDARVAIRATGLTTLSGTVTGPKGPAALFTIELAGPTRAQRSFTNGTFELGRVDPGTYQLRVTSSDGNVAQQVTVAAGAPTTVDLVLVANATVTGRVVDGGGQPVGGVGVTVVADEGDGRLSLSLDGPPLTTKPDGTFRLEHAAGKARVVVLAPGGPVTKGGLVLAPGQTTDAGDVKLPTASPPPPP